MLRRSVPINTRPLDILNENYQDITDLNTKSVFARDTYTRSVSNRPLGKQISLLRDVKEQSTTNIKFLNNITVSLNLDNQIKNEVPYTSSEINYYISLTTTPNRFFQKTTTRDGLILVDEFMEVLGSLSNQKLKPTKIFVSLCTTYTRKFINFRDNGDKTARIREIKSRFPLVEFIETTDFGPATKLLGLLEYNQTKKFLQPNDLIVVVDDDLLYSENLVYSHALCSQLYNCDVVAVNQESMVRTLTPYTFKLTDTFFRDDYNGFLYGWLSFSFRVDATTWLFNFYKDITKQFPDSVYHDDLIFTIYMHRQKLYAVENTFVTLYHDIKNDQSLRDLYKVPSHVINRNILKYSKIQNIPKSERFVIDGRDPRTALDSIDSLQDTVLPSGISRTELERIVFNHYGIRLDDSINGAGFVSRDVVYRIQTSIPTRSRIGGYIHSVSLEAFPEDTHVLFTYVDEQTACMTVSIYNKNLLSAPYIVTFRLNDNRYSVLVTPDKNHVSTKFSYFLHFQKDKLYRSPMLTNNYTLFQTSSTNNVSKNRFYSVSTVLNASIELPYRFFNDDDVYSFVKVNYAKIVSDAIENLVPGAYISDVFRYCYLYLNGGVYVDCKKTIYTNFWEYIDYYKKKAVQTNKGVDIFIKDCPGRMAYNAIMVTDKFSKTVKIALMYAVFMIVNNLYSDDPLNITGPGCLGEAIDYVYNKSYDYVYSNVIPPGREAKDSYVLNRELLKFIKNNYYGYYEENNYVTTNHYHNLWKERKVYRQNISENYQNVKKVSDVVLLKTSILT